MKPCGAEYGLLSDLERRNGHATTAFATQIVGELIALTGPR